MWLRHYRTLSLHWPSNPYTGEEMDWSLIGMYDNDASKEGRHNYKAKFASLPTVDHVEASSSLASFVICTWRTNDAKNDLNLSDFLTLCENVLLHAGYIVNSPPITPKNQAGEHEKTWDTP